MMTAEQMDAMVAWYSYECRVKHRNDWVTIQSIEHYSDDQQAHVAAEIGFYHEHGYLPSWHKMIERVQVVNGAYIFIHADGDEIMCQAH
jgi:hypothetical protein